MYDGSPSSSQRYRSHGSNRTKEIYLLMLCCSAVWFHAGIAPVLYHNISLPLSFLDSLNTLYIHTLKPRTPSYYSKSNSCTFKIPYLLPLFIGAFSGPDSAQNNACSIASQRYVLNAIHVVYPLYTVVPPTD